MIGAGGLTNDIINWRNVCDKELDFWAKSQVLAPPPPEDMPSAFRMPVVGEPVTVTGMRRRPDLNGARGEVVDGALDEFGRITVRVFDHAVAGANASRKMKIHPFRLMPTGHGRSSSTRAGPWRGASPADDGDCRSTWSSEPSVLTCGAKSAASRRRGPSSSASGSALLSNAGRQRLGTPSIARSSRSVATLPREATPSVRSSLSVRDSLETTREFQGGPVIRSVSTPALASLPEDTGG